MSRETLELVQRWIDAWNSGGFDAVVDAYWHDEIELLDAPQFPDAGRHVGKAASRERVESYFEAGWDGQFHVDELIEAGDEVVMVWRLLVRAPVVDIPFESATAFVVLVEDGRVRRIRQYLSKEEALEAVGLRE